MYNICSHIHERCLLEKVLNEFLGKVLSLLLMVKETSFKDKDLDKKTMSFITTS